MEDENYFQIFKWMINLGLKGIELIVYAIIFSFTKEGQEIKASRKYFCELTGATKPTIDKILKKLVNQDLVIKKTKKVNNLIFNSYRVNLKGVVKKFYHQQKNFTTGKEILQGGKEILPIYNNSNNNTKTKEKCVKENKNTIKIEDVKAYAKSRGREDLAQKFYDYYTVNDWKDSNGKVVGNWKQKFILWQSQDPLGYELKRVGAGVEGADDKTVYHGRTYSKEELDSLVCDIDEIEI